jgi:pyruvate formate lyase activating enzyme
MSGAELPVIFDIRRFALDDGPGIRTTVFFKGCPLACSWCHNPESIRADREMAFYPQFCIDCGDCVTACANGAITGNSPKIDRQSCRVCGNCAAACPATALKIIGVHHPVPKLVALLLRDRMFYETSGGGVTFSGGEPTLHMDYLGAALQALQARGIHTAIQTCGMFDLAEFKGKVLPYLDLIFYDLKIFDAWKHAEHTGKANGVILANFADLIGTVPEKIKPRLPLIPGITATIDNLRAIARYLKSHGCIECAILPYNSGGMEKRILLGEITLTHAYLPDLSREEQMRLHGFFRDELA